MRGCLKTLGIILSVLVLIAAIIALVFWLDWKREVELIEQAKDTYRNGDAVSALGYYQELMDRSSLSEGPAQEAHDRSEELELYLSAVTLHEEMQTTDAIAAYEEYLDEYFNIERHGNVYEHRARQALATLKPLQAQECHGRDDYAEAIGVYLSILAIEPLGSDGCEQKTIWDAETTACHEAEAFIEQGFLTAQTAIPTLFLEWADAVHEQENYQEFADLCKSTHQDYPEILNDEQLKERIAQVYGHWAGSLRQAQSYRDAIEVYETILRNYPTTSTAAFAKTALNETRTELTTWLQENPAIPVVEFSEEVSRDSEGTWTLRTVFKEVSGKVGYTLSGSGLIYDAEGKAYGVYGISSISRGSVTVTAGGETEDTYMLKGDTFADGYADFTWEGEDEGGHPITIEERVHLLP